MLLNYRSCMAAAILLFSSCSYATDVRYSTALILTAYDNITRVPEPVNDEYSVSLRGDLSILENTPTLTGRFISSLEFIDYQEDIVADETVGNLLVDGTWRIDPGRFEWFASDTFTQTAIDTTADATPGNRQNVNAFSTGPNYMIRLNSRSNLNFEVRAKEFYYENANADNQRGSFLSGWIYKINSSSDVSLNYSQENADFEDRQANTNFNRSDAYIQFNYSRFNSDLLMELGSTEIQYANGRFNESSRYLVDLNFARRKNANSRLVVSQTISDTGIDLLNQVNEVALNDPVVNSDTFVNKTSRLSHTEILRSGVFTISAYQSTNKYDVQVNLDQERKGGDMSIYWDYTRSSRIRLQARYRNTVYDNLIPYREDDDYFYRAVLAYSINRNTRFNVEVNSTERLSTIDAQVYDDNRLILSLEYASI